MRISYVKKNYIVVGVLQWRQMADKIICDFEIS